MKVKELIKRLKKMDQDAEVIWQSHDQSEDEFDGFVRAVCEASGELLQAENLSSVVVLKP